MPREARLEGEYVLNHSELVSTDNSDVTLHSMVTRALGVEGTGPVIKLSIRAELVSTKAWENCKEYYEYGLCGNLIQPGKQCEREKHMTEDEYRELGRQRNAAYNEQRRQEALKLAAEEAAKLAEQDAGKTTE